MPNLFGTAAFMQINSHDVLIVIDVQNDFCPGGALAVPHGDEVIAPIHRIAPLFQHIVLTQDWHPANHSRSQRRIPARSPSNRSSLPTARRRCGRRTACRARRARSFIPRSSCTQAELILRKGFRPQIDSYSAFFENDRTTPTGLAGYLRERGLTRVFLAGLAYDYLRRLLGARCAPAWASRHLFCATPAAPSTLTAQWPRSRRSLREAGVAVIDSARAFRLKPAHRRIASGRIVRTRYAHVPQLLHPRRHARDLFALISGGMALVPSSFQPGLPANGSLGARWR